MRSASSTVATAATVPRADASVLRTRVISALILAPVALIPAYVGPYLWDALVAVMGALMAWEWAGLCGSGKLSRAGALSMAVAPGAVAARALWGTSPGLAVVAAGALAVGAAARFEQTPNAGWRAAGVVYVGLPCLAMAWLRARPEDGLATLLWVLALVWATDTGAYVAGRGIGGPKLARRISPNKTWAGLGGGIVAAAAIGWAAYFSGVAVAVIVPLSAALAVVEQLGDLFESAVKRHFGAKDSSRLIPGHGGVLDRVDGLLAVSLAVAALSAASGHTILIWR